MRFRLLLSAVITAGTLITGGLFAAANAAGASTAQPAPRHWDQHAKPVQVEIQFADDFADNYHSADALVLGPGHRQLLNATDTQNPAGTVDTLADNAGDSIEAWHPNSLGAGTLDLAVCQARFTLDDARAILFGGLGSYAHVYGPVTYDQTIVFSFGDTRRGRCSIDGDTVDQVTAFLSAGVADNGPITHGATAYCKRHHIPVPVLLTDTGTVQARGLVRAPRDERPEPYASPSPTVTA